MNLYNITLPPLQVWMNNHRPRKTMANHTNVGLGGVGLVGAGQYMSSVANSTGFYSTTNTADHAREINKVQEGFINYK